MESAESPGPLERAREFRKGQTTALKHIRAAGLRPEARGHLDLLRQNPRYQEAKQIVVEGRGEERMRGWEEEASQVPEFSPEAWETAGRVFSGVNNGVKAALLVEIANNTHPKTESGPGTYISIDDLADPDHFQKLFAGTNLLVVLSHSSGHGSSIKKMVTEYCQQSLCNIGLVTEEYNNAGGLVGFGITEEGLNFGVPAALLTLALENSRDQSVYPILGRTNSRGDTRALLNRTQILDYLARHPKGLRTIDLSSVSKLHRSQIGSSLELFDALALVKYKALASVGDRVPLKYGLNPIKNLEAAPNVSARSTWQRHIINAINTCSQNQKDNFSIQEIINELPPEFRANRNDKNLRINVSRILSRLAEEGFLLRVGGWRGGKKQSDITLTSKGRAITTDLIWPVLSIISGTPLTEEQQKIMQQVRVNLPAFAQKSAELYYPHSASSKQRAERENLQKAINFLAQHPEKPQNLKQIAMAIGLSPGAIDKHFKPKIPDSNVAVVKIDEQTFRIARERIKRVNHYSLAA